MIQKGVGNGVFYYLFIFCNPMMDGEGKGRVDGNYDVYEPKATNNPATIPFYS
jgi:hypothetical protein